MNAFDNMACIAVYPVQNNDDFKALQGLGKHAPDGPRQ